MTAYMAYGLRCRPDRAAHGTEQTAPPPPPPPPRLPASAPPPAGRAPAPRPPLGRIPPARLGRRRCCLQARERHTKAANPAACILRGEGLPACECAHGLPYLCMYADFCCRCSKSARTHLGGECKQTTKWHSAVCASSQPLPQVMNLNRRRCPASSAHALQPCANAQPAAIHG